jgi:hypothetical protein
MKKLVLSLLLVSIWMITHAIVITQWDFESQTLSPSIGSGTLNLTGNVANDGFNTGSNSTWGFSTTNYPPQSTNNLTAGIYFEVSTVGYTYITLSWSQRHSNTSANRAVLYYTLDKTAITPVWHLAGTYDATSGDAWFQRTYDGSAERQLGSNPNVAFKIVSSFADTGNTVYMPSRPTSVYASTGKWRFDNITIEGTPLSPALQITSNLVPFYALVNGYSAIQNYSLHAYSLTSNLLITSTQYFEIREMGGSTFTNSLSLTPTSGNIITTIEVQYHPTVSGNQAGVISHSSNGLSTQDLNISGSTIIPEPTSHVTNFHANNISYYQVHLNWSDSQGSILPSGYLIKGSKISPDSIAYPVDGIVENTKKLTKYVDYGIQTILFSDLDENQSYYFKIFPYTNSSTAINYKTDGTIPLLSVSTIVGPVGTILNAGDITFVEYSSATRDHFAFVLLREIAENTKVNFTDNAWDGSALLTGEDVYLWRGVGRTYARGEVIHIVEDTLYSNEGIVEPNFSGFSNNGDQILAFQGETTSPFFIAGFSTTNWIISGVPTNNSSYLPSTLILGETALGFSSKKDNGCYNGIITNGTAVQFRTATNNPLNWIRDNSLANMSFPAWDLTIQLASVSNITLEMIDAQTLRISWLRPGGALSYTVYAASDPYGLFPDTWQILQSGIEDDYIDVPINSVFMHHYYRIITEY